MFDLHLIFLIGSNTLLDVGEFLLLSGQVIITTKRIYLHQIIYIIKMYNLRGFSRNFFFDKQLNHQRIKSTILKIYFLQRMDIFLNGRN